MSSASFIGHHGRLRFICASKATLTVNTPLAHHKLAHLVFSHDAIFVQFPYFEDQAGVPSRVELEPKGESDQQHLKLDEHGKVTSHLVKLSHHIDGIAHFSQDGKVRTEIRRQSFRLDNSIGPVFQLFAFWLSGFAQFDPKTAKQDRAYIQFQSLGSHVFGVNLQGEWRRKHALEANIEGTGPAGPETSVVHRNTSVKTQVVFLSPPASHPLGTHVLMLACSKADPPAGITKPLVMLLGGWDHGEVKEGDPPLQQTGCLACLYPVSSPAELAERIGSIDFKPKAVSFSAS